MTGFSRTDILLLRYAAGSLNKPRCCVIVIWLVFDRKARRKVAAFEALGGELIHAEPPSPVSAECLEIVLRRIETPPRIQTPLERILEMLSRF